MNASRNRWIGVTAVLIAATSASSAIAQELSRTDRKLFGGDFSFNGLFRVETAFSTSSQVSAANQFGLGTNGRAVNRKAGVPSNGQDNNGFKETFTSSSDLTNLINSIPGASLPPFDPTNPSGTVSGNPRGVTNNTGVSDTMTRYIPRRDTDINYHLLRFEITPSINWSGGFSLISRLRAVYDPGGMGYRDFDYGDYDDINNYEPGSFATNRIGPARRQYRGKPDYLGYEVDNEKNPILFERSGKNYQIDLPAFFLQWTNGNITARVGNQSVAWGQLLFFRIMDVANGLDLRRHLFLDRAIEEYADERMSAPGLRLTWQATDQIVIDGFAQQFIPTVLPNANTTYNIVDARFVLHDNYFDNNNDEDINFGVRLKGEFGSFNGQLMYTSRYNQLGAIRWAKSNINKRLPNTNYLGAAFNQYCENALGSPAGQGCGPQLAETPFEASVGGLFSAEEWFDRASYTRLDGVIGLNHAVRDFQPTTGMLLTSEVDPNQSNAEQVDQANNELDAFFMASEGLHGHVERNYFREDVFGIGGGIVTEGELGSFMDQIIINIEATYTPDRMFTSPALAKGFDERDEVQVGLVMEKYHRFSNSVPATYMVFQYLWQKESSLEGLLLDGYGSENYKGADNPNIVLTDGVPTSADPKITPGVNGGAHYVVLAALLPGPQYIFEYSVATLIDVQGGVLVQPGVQWKPVGSVTVNAFYNYLDADLWGNNPHNSFVSFIDFADEFCLRLGYQF